MFNPSVHLFVGHPSRSRHLRQLAMIGGWSRLRPPPDVVAVVLAAGAGTRFAGPGHKLDAAVDGRAVVDRAVGAALAAAIGPVVVVTAGQLATPLPRGRRPRRQRAVVRRPDHLAASRHRRRQRPRRRGRRRRSRRPAVRHARGVAGRRRDRRADRRRHLPRPPRPPGPAAPRHVGAAAHRAATKAPGRCSGGRPDLVTAVPCEGSPIDIDTRGGSPAMAEQLVNEFTVNRPIDEAWAVITDVERIAPCLPGAQLQEIEGDVYRGIVKIKLGSITPQFKGQASFVERDDDGPPGRAQGRGPRHRWAGQRRRRRSRPRPRASRRRAPRVVVTTDLHITGKVAQFGRGIIGDVSKKLMAQFAGNLNTMLDEQPVNGDGSDTAAAVEPAAETTDTTEATADAESAHSTDRGEAAATGGPAVPEPATGDASGAAQSEPRVRKIDSPATEPVDLAGLAGPAAAQAAGAGRRRSARAAVRPAPPTLTGWWSTRSIEPPSAPCSDAIRSAASRSSYATATGAPVVIRNAPLLDDGTPDADALLARRTGRGARRQPAGVGGRGAPCRGRGRRRGDRRCPPALRRRARRRRPGGRLGRPFGRRRRHPPGRQVPPRPLRLAPRRRRRPGGQVGGRQAHQPARHRRRRGRRRRSPTPATTRGSRSARRRCWRPTSSIPTRRRRRS